jgi:hypothetical protein
MDVGFSEFLNTLLRIGPVLIIYLVITVLLVEGGAGLFAIQKFLLSDHLPVNRPARPLERWWSGLFFSGGVLSQIFFACYFALPFLAGAILMVLCEVFYLQHPESIPWQVNLPVKTGLWPTPGQLYFLFGLIFIFPGITYSKIRADFLPRTTGVFRHLNRMGAYSMIVLAAASLFVLILAFFFIRPYAYYCVVLTIPIAIFSAIVAYWLLTNLDAP